jgi:hypothetical protein
MNHNIGITLDRKSLRIISAFFSGFLFTACVVASVWLNTETSTTSDNQVQETEAALTQVHGDEVRSSIAHYWMLLGSLEARHNPDVIYAVATGELADYLVEAYKKVNYSNEPYLLLTTAVEIRKLRIVEFDSQRFKSIACVKESINRVALTDERLLDSYQTDRCYIFVFLNNDQIWKVAGYIDIDDPQSYSSAPDWLKTIIGDVPK